MVSTYNRMIKYFVFLLSDSFLLIERVGDFRETEKNVIKKKTKQLILI